MEMRLLRKIKGKTRRDRIRNDEFREELKVKLFLETVAEAQLRWYGHVQRPREEKVAKKASEARIIGKKPRERPRKTWKEGLNEAARSKGIDRKNMKTLTKDRNKWKEL